MLSQFAESLRARLLTTSTLAQETSRDGQTLINNFFQSTVVDDTPAFVLANDFSRLLNFGEIVTNNAVAAVQAQGQDVDVFNFRSGRIEANNGPDALATGVQVTGSAAVRNFGEIAGEFNGVQFAGAESSGSLDNFRGAVISSDSRAVDIQGQGIDVRNFGDIVGTGDQRNGTIYTNATAEDISISNFTGGTIDAGEGNQGAGISLQIGDEAGDRVQTDVFNGFGATIQGRGQAAANTPLAGDGIRIDDGAEGTILETEIINSGLISTESNQGTAAGIRIADGANAEGEILNTSTGVIEGPRNGLYIGNGEHDLDVLNFGTIQSGSRAVNIDGSGVDLINGGISLAPVTSATEPSTQMILHAIFRLTIWRQARSMQASTTTVRGSLCRWLKTAMVTLKSRTQASSPDVATRVPRWARRATAFVWKVCVRTVALRLPRLLAPSPTAGVSRPKVETVRLARSGQ